MPSADPPPPSDSDVPPQAETTSTTSTSDPNPATISSASSPSPPPQVPTGLTPGPRATAFAQLYSTTLTHTLGAISYAHFAACFPTMAAKASGPLRAMHADVVRRLETFARDEFDQVMRERDVVKALNGLEDVIAEARKRKARAVEKDGVPVAPHTLPARAIAAAHMAPLLASQQSQYNAKLQTVQSQNATLAKTVVAQRAEMEELIRSLEAVVGDLDAANALLESDSDARVRDATSAEVLMSNT